MRRNFIKNLEGFGLDEWAMVVYFSFVFGSILSLFNANVVLVIVIGFFALCGFKFYRKMWGEK